MLKNEQVDALIPNCVCLDQKESYSFLILKHHILSKSNETIILYFLMVYFIPSGIKNVHYKKKMQYTLEIREYNTFIPR